MCSPHHSHMPPSLSHAHPPRLSFLRFSPQADKFPHHRPLHTQQILPIPLLLPHSQDDHRRRHFTPPHRRRCPARHCGPDNHRYLDHRHRSPRILRQKPPPPRPGRPQDHLRCCFLLGQGVFPTKGRRRSCLLLRRHRFRLNHFCSDRREALLLISHACPQLKSVNI
ncbi:unnamed protein product [Cuscuta epithymum]|uniref:Uncharacterized protein n=1 Tax=Cuscuta epithymum TaxID=186058 RepID=A0AAV0FXU2_9ASTE|nr:unnamed protein product [Cuscuta epithymum]